MRNRNRSNVLLVEILITVFFFMLSATVLVQVFATARNMTERSDVESMALIEAQNVAEALYVSEDVDATLTDLAFASSHGAWSKDCGNYTLYVMGITQTLDAGELWTGTVSAYYKLRNPDIARAEDEELFSLPCARYREVLS
ncbi:MAG: hypothetical protein IJ124_09075 [Clostridia bacterium]|nr:hypothetical protein [Clostridia bacterium]